ncbi:hypothetical protein GWK47_040115 [Chionoecetes opilio]|uniref:Uncharacterized protein n=1 Tax=Chionoecetes opilio TaxID=41210 RepID=A0A8J5D116_CHIOP|nr:hypothetical protein GWK47_040115 [Chionoecetes opilio]
MMLPLPFVQKDPRGCFCPGQLVFKGKRLGTCPFVAKVFSLEEEGRRVGLPEEKVPLVKDTFHFPPGGCDSVDRSGGSALPPNKTVRVDHNPPGNGASAASTRQGDGGVDGHNGDFGQRDTGRVPRVFWQFLYLELKGKKNQGALRKRVPSTRQPGAPAAPPPTGHSRLPRARPPAPSPALRACRAPHTPLASTGHPYHRHALAATLTSESPAPPPPPFSPALFSPTVALFL